MRFPTLKEDIIALDTETTGLTAAHKMFAFSIAVDGWSAYFDIREEPRAMIWLLDQIANHKGLFVFHNAPFDWGMLYRMGALVPIMRVDDTNIRAVLINEHEHSFSLDHLCRKYLGKGKVEPYEELAGIFGGKATRNVQAPNFHRAPLRLMEEYGTADAELTLELWRWQEKEINKQDLTRIAEFERRVTPTILDMSVCGIRVDTSAAEQAMDKLTPIIKEKQTQLDEVAGWQFNVNSGPQVKKLFNPTWDKREGWKTNDGTICKKTKNGNPSIDSEILSKMTHPAAGLISDIRSLIKTRDTFLGGHILAHHVDGRVYPHVNQLRTDEGFGTITGRLSYTGPALQQIPSRNKEVAAIVKPCFLPDEGQVWLDTDLASFEVRVFVHLARVKKLIEAYHDDPFLDAHQWVADQTGLPRNAQKSGGGNAKQLNLSMIFNQGNGATAMKMGLPWEWDEFNTATGERVRYKKAGSQAMEVINRYHRNMPGVLDLRDRAKEIALKYGYTQTQMGRKIRFPDPKWTYKASGLTIQATAADFNKKFLQEYPNIIGDRGRLMLNTHDSYSISVDRDEVNNVYADLAEYTAGDHLRLPLILEQNGVGNNWWEALSGAD